MKERTVRPQVMVRLRILSSQKALVRVFRLDLPETGFMVLRKFLPRGICIEWAESSQDEISVPTPPPKSE